MNKIFQTKKDNVGFGSETKVIGFAPHNCDWAFEENSEYNDLHLMFEPMAKFILEYTSFKTLLDIGSGVGSLAYFLRKLAAERGREIEVYTLDGYQRTKESKFIDPLRHIVCRSDQEYQLEDENGNPMVFDLIVSFEHLEHIQEENIFGWFENVRRHCNLGKTSLILTANRLDYGTPDVHCNAQPFEWWLNFITNLGWVSQEPNYKLTKAMELRTGDFVTQGTTPSGNLALIPAEGIGECWMRRFTESTAWLRDTVKHKLELTDGQLVTKKEILRSCFLPKKVVWVNGCFDVMHRGHLGLLEYAKSCGDVLIVGIDDDEKVKRDKGDSRPFNNQEDRKYFLESLRAVDQVVVFCSKEGLEKAIGSIQPDVMVVGSDWEGKDVVGAQHAGEVKYFNRIGNYSTTKILEK